MCIVRGVVGGLQVWGEFESGHYGYIGTVDFLKFSYCCSSDSGMVGVGQLPMFLPLSHNRAQNKSRGCNGKKLAAGLHLYNPLLVLTVTTVLEQVGDNVKVLSVKQGWKGRGVY